MKLFVGSLSWNTTDDGLRAAFAAFGDVEEAKVIMDRDTGRSRGFGFVTMDDDGAQRAMDELNGADLDGRTIAVNEARERTGGRGGRGGPGGGGGRGGFGGGGGGGDRGGYGGGGGRGGGGGYGGGGNGGGDRGGYGGGGGRGGGGGYGGGGNGGGGGGRW